MNIVKEEQYNSLCRLCLRQSKELVDIFANIENSTKSNDTLLSTKIMACVSIEVSPNDRGPKKICSKCLDNINSWHEFKTSCDSANNVLKKILTEMLEENKSVLSEKIPPPEDIALFPEISLFSYDTFMDRSVSFASNISSVVDYFLNTDKNKENETSTGNKKEINFSEEIKRHSLDMIKASSNQDQPCKPEEPTDSLVSEENKPRAKNTSKGYKCEICDQHFTYFSVLLTHDETSHSTLARNYSCSICGRLFILRNRVDTHVKLNHREKSFQCPLCDKFFVSAKSLKVHSRLHSEMYKCKVCGFVSTSKVYLNQHTQKHQGAEVSFICEICRKTFTQKSSLIRHQKLHFENHGKCFKCSVCHILFRSHSELVSHKSSHCEPRIYEKFRCRCNKIYKSKSALTTHLKVHQQPFICSICEKKLKSKYDLRVHLETHSDCKRFSCFHCDKKFSFKNTLIRHLKKHYPRVRSDLNV